MGHIPTTLCRTTMRSAHIKHEMHLKCLDDPVAIVYIYIYLGIISHDEHLSHPGLLPFLRLWQQLLWHFWPWLQTPK